MITFARLACVLLGCEADERKALAHVGVRVRHDVHLGHLAVPVRHRECVGGGGSDTVLHIECVRVVGCVYVGGWV